MKARILAEENRKWLTLAAVSFGLFMIMLDNTVVNVALPSIQSDFRADLSELEWIVTGYALTFAALMLIGGKVADAYGRRLVFVIGIVVFSLASLGCGLAESSEQLIAARIVQGAGAALMNPATLSIIAATFPPRQRGTAIGIWAGVSAMALAIGPLVGGLITEHLDWSWIFFVNIPVGVVAIVASFLFIDESRDETHERLDLPGLATSALGLFALTYGLIEANTYGWTSPRILGAFAVAAVALVVFVLLERHQRAPMLPLELFRNRTYTGANLVVLLVALAMFGVFFFMSLYMQTILGYSAVQTGAAFLPLTILIILVAPVAGRTTDRIGSRGSHDRRDDPYRGPARVLLATGPGRDVLGLAPGLRPRRHRDGADDDAERGRGHAQRARREVRRRGRGAEQRAPGRRHHGYRGHGRDHGPPGRGRAYAGGIHARLRARSARRGRHRRRRRGGRVRARAPARGSRTGGRARRGAGRVTSATRLPAAERRREIVEAALRVFSNGSYAGATTAGIAREAGVSEPILYRHFASKRELYFACLDEAWRRIRTRVDETIDELGAERGWQALGPATLREVKVLLPSLWMQAITEAGEDPEIRTFVRAHMREVHDYFAEVLRRLQAEGVIAADRDPEAEAWVFVAGTLLVSVADRLGGPLTESDFDAIKAQRQRWLTGER